ncbi:Small G protein signaling modulator 1 [Nibea albiflora]|uniref:Small G protein signaling modulator 1 n=1 Tax=Nibea albiflora TaxID=240163 RepID=A0ACB7FCM4_NIBAL|nr:Small G protein signaling modulator 1 [Nibea albiflora]
MWHPTLRKSSCSSCSQGSFSDGVTPKGCNHERAPLKLLCDNMKYQIISRAFYGWLAYCRHLSTVRTHLSALVNHTIVAPDVPRDAYKGLTTDVWQAFLQDCTVDEQVRVCYQQTMREWLGCEEIVRQREKEQHAAALAKCISGASMDSSSQKMIHHDSTVSNEVKHTYIQSHSSQSSDRQSLARLQSDSSSSTQVFESVEEVDQIETEPKNEEAKQVPKMPNGALQNGTSSPDSGHPSSRNFSVTSGLSDGSLSTEDSGAPDTAPRSAAVPQAPQSPVKPAGVESDGLTEDRQAKGKVKDKEEEAKEVKAADATKTAENTKTEVTGGNMNQPLKEELVKEPRIQETVEESGAIETEGPKCEDKDLADIKGSLESGDKETSGVDTMMVSSEKEVEVNNEETSKLEKTAETNVENEMEKSKTSKPQEVSLADGKENTFRDPAAPEVEKNLVFSADSEVSRARETYFTSQKDEAQVMTESDESPSAIEMEEIPKAKVSMVPWSRKGRCEASSFSEDSAPHVELRQEEEQGKPSPEGTESILSEEPEMESLYPNFDSLTGSENTKNEATSQESTTGSPFSQELLDLYTLNLHRIEKDVQRCDRNYWYFTPANLEKLRNIMCSYIWRHLDIGYVQGMCDLLAPLLVILDDGDCFTELMKRMNQNFPHGGAMDTHFANMRSLIQILDSELFELMHQNGDYTHFYFCYRWFLLDFKRELVYDDVFAVWETIWAAKYVSSNHFVLFIALALVEIYRDIILENNMDFTDIIKFFNEMAEHHSIKQILTQARDLVYKVQMLIENK